MNLKTAMTAAALSVALPATALGQDAPAETVRATVESTRELSSGRDPLSAERRKETATLALVVRLVISVDEVRLENEQLRHLAHPPRPPSEGLQLIEARALSAAREEVGFVTVADPRISVAEGMGIVVRDDRAVSLAIPLKARPASLEFFISGRDPNALPLSFDVTGRMDELCREFPQAAVC